MQAQETPNPLSLKFLIPGGATRGEYLSFFSAQEVKHFPVLKEILELPGVEHIFLAPDFMTVTRKEETPWSLLQSIILCVLQHYKQSFPLENITSSNSFVETPETHIQYTEDERAIVEEIETLIATRVRPNVEADGGTIQFAYMVNGIVYVRLEGACAGCPHSSQTLTYGIENLLKYYIPEVQRVEAVTDDMVSVAQY